MSLSPSEWFNVSPDNLLYGGWLAQHYTPSGDAMVEIYYPAIAVLFPGIIAWILILVGAFRSDMHRFYSRLFFGVIIFSILISIGWVPFNFFKDGASDGVLLYILGKFLPLFSIIRMPYRVILLFSLAAGLLAGGGYVVLERKVLAKIKLRHAGWVGVAIVLLLINLENLAIPRPLHNYDEIFSPGEGISWLKDNNLPKPPNDLILYLPSERDISPGKPYFYEKMIGDYYIPLFSHLHSRYPTPNGITSFVPTGFVPYNCYNLPAMISQKHYSAIGVEYIVVNEHYLFGRNKIRFGSKNMVRHGITHLKSFADGSSVYRMDDHTINESDLYVAPRMTRDQLSIMVMTPEVYNTAIKRGIPFKQDEGAFFWVNPKLCKIQKMRITIADGRDRIHSKKFSYSLPLVIGGVIEVPVKWELKSEKFKGPYRVVSIECKEPYLLQPPDTKQHWKLLYK